MDVRKWNPMCSKKVNINLSVKAGNEVSGLIFFSRWAII